MQTDKQKNIPKKRIYGKKYGDWNYFKLPIISMNKQMTKLELDIEQLIQEFFDKISYIDTKGRFNWFAHNTRELVNKVIKAKELNKWLTGKN